MALLEKLGLVTLERLQRLVDAVGNLVELAAGLSAKVEALEGRVAALEEGEARRNNDVLPPSLLDCGFCGKRHASYNCPSIVEAAEKLTGECDGRPCTCSSAGDVLEHAAEGEPISLENCQQCGQFREHGHECRPPRHPEDDGTWAAQREAARQSREFSQDTGTTFDDWQMDAVRKAIAERLKDFVGQKWDESTAKAALWAATQEVEDMRRRFGVTRKYRVDVRQDGDTFRGTITIDVNEA